MEKAQPMMDNTLSRSGAIAMHPNTYPTRYQIGDPGRFLRAGMFQELLLQIERRGIDPRFGYTIEIRDPETGEKGRITGILTSYVGVFLPDDGERDLGCFLTETGHLAIAEMAICVEPEPCDQCRWIEIGERFTVMAGPGSLRVHGTINHLRFDLPSQILPMESQIRRAA